MLGVKFAPAVLVRLFRLITDFIGLIRRWTGREAISEVAIAEERFVGGIIYEEPLTIRTEEQVFQFNSARTPAIFDGERPMESTLPAIAIRSPTYTAQSQEIEPADSSSPRLSPSNSTRRNSASSIHSNEGFPRKNQPRRSSISPDVCVSLRDMLRRARKEYPPNSHTFIVPKCEQERLITVSIVDKYLQAKSPYIGPNEARDTAEKTCDVARQLFGTLASFSKGEKISLLLSEGITDQDLPFQRRSNNLDPFALQRKSGEFIRAFEDWTDDDLEDFDQNQYWFTAPVFEEREHYELEDNRILPFIPFQTTAETQETKQGAYSEVYPVRIHPSHHEFWKRSLSEQEEPLVAIKKLNSPDEKQFLKEVEILNALGPKKHPHLVQLLATFRQKKKYHLIFPYANANLRKYWETRKQTMFDRVTILWSLEQMTGIANGLLLIHNFSVPYPLSVDGEVRVQKDVDLSVRKGEELYGRHGDIKPENILYFEKHSKDKYGLGILQIADFGLGRFHGRDSRSRVDPNTVFSSPTYEPPECLLRRPVSRTYDIWSLGCLFLEFVTWLLKGCAEIESFSEFRGMPASNDINDDNFFTIKKDQFGGTYAVVRDKVVQWVDQLHEDEKCSALIHDLLELIMNQVLLVESANRASAACLFSQLKEILERAEKDDKYLLKPAPRLRPGGNERPNSTPATSGTTPKSNSKRNVTFADQNADIVAKLQVSGTPNFKPKQNKPSLSWPIVRSGRGLQTTSFL